VCRIEFIPLADYFLDSVGSLVVIGSAEVVMGGNPARQRKRILDSLVVGTANVAENKEAFSLRLQLQKKSSWEPVLVEEGSVRGHQASASFSDKRPSRSLALSVGGLVMLFIG
jgi:hypothetical protein